jgi:hypothetical protein
MVGNPRETVKNTLSTQRIHHIDHRILHADILGKCVEDYAEHI